MNISNRQMIMAVSYGIKANSGNALLENLNVNTTPLVYFQLGNFVACHTPPLSTLLSVYQL